MHLLRSQYANASACPLHGTTDTGAVATDPLPNTSATNPTTGSDAAAIAMCGVRRRIAALRHVL